MQDSSIGQELSVTQSKSSTYVASRRPVFNTVTNNGFQNYICCWLFIIVLHAKENNC